MLIIRNISDHTISTSLYGRLLEIPIGGSIASDEFWGGEESVLILAIKNKNELKLTNEKGEEITEVICPVCGAKVNLSTAKPTPEEVIQEVQKEITKTKRVRK
ncbi:MAG: hypothetical protein ACPL1B_09145 [Thermoprotei archaeon]